MPVPLDVELVRRTAEGDETAFEELIHRYEETVYRIAYRYVSDAEEAEDVAQEVFIKVWRHARSFAGKSTFSTWLYRIVVNQCLNHRRKQKKLPDALDPETASDDRGGSPETDMARKNDVETVRRAVDSLPGRQRLALILAKYEGKSYKEIAEIMKVSVSTVESLLYRARVALRKMLLPLREKEEI